METESFGQKAKRKTTSFLKKLSLIALLLFVGWFCYSYFFVVDEGVRAGFVLKVSKKGLMFKTYEGQLNLETFGSLKGTTAVAETFDFSVDSGNEKVITDLEAVALSGERVSLRYIKRPTRWFWRGDTKYFVVGVERLGTPTPPVQPVQ